MSSEQDQYPEDQLPTPANTPAPFLESPDDSDKDSSGPSHSAHTATPILNSSIPTVHISTMSNVLEFGTPAQRQAAHVTNILHKTPIKPILTASNYTAWLDSVRFGLSAASYDSFLETDEMIEEEGYDEKMHLATKKCIFNWLLANMETSQSTRFVSMISKF